MTFTFKDSTPVLRSVGRPAEPNPFTDIIAEIAYKKDDKDRPLAKEFNITKGEYFDDGKPANDDAKTFLKVLRQLSEAGNLQNPPVTVHKNVSDFIKVAGKPTSKVTITFWTSEKIRKNRKAAVTETNTTEDTDAQ